MDNSLHCFKNNVPLPHASGQHRCISLDHMSQYSIAAELHVNREFHPEVCCKHIPEFRGLQIVGSVVGKWEGGLVGANDGSNVGTFDGAFVGVMEGAEVG